MAKYRVEIRREDIGNWWGEADSEEQAVEKAVAAVMADTDDDSYEWYDGEVTTNDVVLDEDK